MEESTRSSLALVRGEESMAVETSAVVEEAPAVAAVVLGSTMVLDRAAGGKMEVYSTMQRGEFGSRSGLAVYCCEGSGTTYLRAKVYW